jgi:hypothetical protein
MALPNQHLASMEAYLQRTHGYLQKAQGTKDKGKKQQGGGGNKFLRKARVFDAATMGEAGVSKATELHQAWGDSETETSAATTRAGGGHPIG